MRTLRHTVLWILPCIMLCLHSCANHAPQQSAGDNANNNHWYSIHAARNQKKQYRYQVLKRRDVAHLKHAHLATNYRFLDREETDLLTRVHHLGVRVIHENIRLRLIMPPEAGFKANSSTVNPALMSILDRVAHVLKINKQTIGIAHGFSDARGDQKANQALSERRAHAVIAYLEAQGVPSFRLVTKGHGSARPKAGNGNERGRRLNRRIELTIHKGCQTGDNYNPIR